MYAMSATLPAFSGCSDYLSDNVIYSTLDVWHGQSGSAVWDGDNVIRAIVVGVDDNGNGKSILRTISEAVFEQVEALVDERA